MRKQREKWREKGKKTCCQKRRNKNVKTHTQRHTKQTIRKKIKEKRNQRMKNCNEKKIPKTKNRKIITVRLLAIFLFNFGFTVVIVICCKCAHSHCPSSIYLFTFGAFTIIFRLNLFCFILFTSTVWFHYLFIYCLSIFLRMVFPFRFLTRIFCICYIFNQLFSVWLSICCLFHKIFHSSNAVQFFLLLFFLCSSRLMCAVSAKT